MPTPSGDPDPHQRKIQIQIILDGVLSRSGKQAVVFDAEGHPGEFFIQMRDGEFSVQEVNELGWMIQGLDLEVGDIIWSRKVNRLYLKAHQREEKPKGKQVQAKRPYSVKEDPEDEGKKKKSKKGKK